MSTHRCPELRPSRAPRVSAALAALVLAAGGWLGRGAAPAAGAAPRPTVDVTGATRIEYDDAAARWVFRGARVVLTRGDVRVEAPEILYAERDREVQLPAGGMVRTAALEVYADHMRADLRSRHVTADGRVHGRFAAEGETAMTGTFTAGHAEADDRPDLRRFVATGGVVVQQPDRRLSGDRVVYDQSAGRGTVDGGAELTRGGDRLQAEHIVADLERHEATAEVGVVLERRDMTASADHGAYSEARQTAVLTGHVVMHHAQDTMTADRITVLLDQHTAIADGHVELVAYPEGGAAPPGGRP
jgi:lipopolysaccharide export system protein LptA